MRSIIIAAMLLLLDGCDTRLIKYEPLADTSPTTAPATAWDYEVAADFCTTRWTDGCSKITTILNRQTAQEAADRASADRQKELDKQRQMSELDAIAVLLTALAQGKFRPPTGMAYIIEADFLETPEVGEVSAAADEWSRTA
jgi:uncharacterized protein YceK